MFTPNMFRRHSAAGRNHWTDSQTLGHLGTLPPPKVAYVLLSYPGPIVCTELPPSLSRHPPSTAVQWLTLLDVAKSLSERVWDPG